MKLSVLILALAAAYASATYSRITLPYAQDALETAIDAETVDLHYNKHHAAYETNTNAAVTEINTFYKQKTGSDKDLIAEDEKLEDVLYKLADISSKTKKDDETIPEGSYSQLAQKLRNNGGGLINHNLYFESFKAYSDADTTPASGSEIEALITKQYGDFNTFKQALITSATSVFGSGWTFAYVKRGTDEVVIATYPNQDSPYMDGHFPFLGIDVWEHAYYLNYKNIRGTYLQNIFKIFDWNVINENYVKALEDSKNAPSSAMTAGTVLAFTACFAGIIMAFL